MVRLGPWVCDQCDASIVDAGAGYVVWDRLGDGPEVYRIIHRGRCDDKSYRTSMPLDSFIGPDGLTSLLGFLSIGPIKRALGEAGRPSVRDMDAFVDFIRRVQIPGYEQARVHFGDPDVLDRFSDASESYPYRQNAIDEMLRSAAQGI